MTTGERRAEYRRQVLQRAGEATLDIPDLRILKTAEPHRLLERFEASWDVKPTSVVLPAVSPDGVNFDNTCGLPISRTAAAVDFRNAVNAFASAGCDVYVSMDPGFRFINSAPLLVVDSSGDSARRACITKPRVQEVISHTIADAVGLVLDGVEGTGAKLLGIAVDSVDLWPMSAADGRIDLTCFCTECVDKLGAEELARFQDFPNPSNLLLRDSGTGIGYADTIQSDASPEKVLSLSRLKGYVEIFEKASRTELQKHAEGILDYMRARHRMTVESLVSMIDSGTERARNESEDLLDGALRRIVLAEGSQYNWTAGLFVDLLDSEGPFDEIWLDPSTTEVSLKRVASRAYMWRRCRYAVDAFFEYAAAVADPALRAITGLGRLEEFQVVRVLEGRLRTSLGASMTGFTNLSALAGEVAESPEGPGRLGFIGVALDEALGAGVLMDVDVAPSADRA